MLKMIKNAGTAVKKFMLTSGEDIYNDEHYEEEEYEYEQEQEEEDPARDHYSRRPPERERERERQPRQPRVDYTEKVVSLGYTPTSQPGYNQSRFQSNNAQQSSQGGTANNSRSMIIPAASVISPKEFRDVLTISGDLLGGKLVVVDVTNLESVMAQRITDYLSGVVTTIQGNMKRINSTIYMVSPPGYEISTQESENIKEYSHLKAVHERF